MDQGTASVASAAAMAAMGATPVGWASMAGQAVGAIASTSKPAGDSSADAMFGSVLSNFDSSGWMVNFGNGASQTSENAHAGPTQAVSQEKTTGTGTASQFSGYLPYVLIFAGALVLLKVWKQR